MSLSLADKGARLYNYAVDMVVISVIMFFAFFFIMMGFNPEGNLIYYMVCFLAYYGYYFLFEWSTGKTLGKLLTNTKVTDVDGNPPTWMQILTRTFFRLPFIDGISLLLRSETGIHDALSGTRVVKIR
jgi:uncharacterized RDD family membrane protein YckC